MRFRDSLFLIAVLLPACTNTPTIVLKPNNSPQALKVGFARAFFSPSQTGEDQIVLLSDPIDAPTDAAPGVPLSAAASPPLWQVLSISLHWRASASPKLDALVASNAVLHFYVYGKPTGHDLGVVHYIGSGSVAIDVDSTGAQVSISHAEMKLADRHGQIRDPFGQFRISGNFRAQTDPAAAKQSMDDVRKAISEVEQFAVPTTLRSTENTNIEH